MNYFSLFQLAREPFSNSPDPDFFYQAPQYLECLHHLEISIRLKRGLNLVLGEVGAGKSTLCRQLLKNLAPDQTIVPRLILDPSCASAEEFLLELCRQFAAGEPEPGASQWRLKEMIKQALFRLAVDEERTVVLVIDEGQKIPPDCLEILRELLNYETNEHKMLQIVLLAQTEFAEVVAARPNLADRINSLVRLAPLDRTQTREMIRFRLCQAGAPPGGPDLFTFGGYLAVHRLSGGHPRRIITLCHKTLLSLIMQNRRRAGWRTVMAAGRDGAVPGQGQDPAPARTRPALILALGAMVGGLAVLFLARPGLWEGRPAAPDPSGVRASSEAPAPVSAPVSAPAPASTPTEPSATRAKDAPARPILRPGPAPAQAAPPPGSGRGGSPDLAAVAALGPDPGSPTPAAAPALLGEAALGRQEHLSEMIRVIYGTYDHRHIRPILEANPGLKDPRLLQAGTVIAFPALVRTPAPAKDAAHFVALAASRRLAEACALDRSLRAKGLGARLLPVHSPERGLFFLEVLVPAQASREAARAALAALPPDLARQAFVVSEWDPGTVFHSSLGYQPR